MLDLTHENLPNSKKEDQDLSSTALKSVTDSIAMSTCAEYVSKSNIKLWESKCIELKKEDL